MAFRRILGLLGALGLLGSLDVLAAQEAKLTATNATPSDELGAAVSASDGRVLAGARWHGSPGAENAGAAYVFVRRGVGWTQEATLTAPNGSFGDYFGSSVGLSGELAIVGAPGDDTAGLNAGSATIFRFMGAAWQLEQKLTAPDAHSNFGFGVAVAAAGDRVLIGAPGDSNVAGHASGSAYVFERRGGAWVLEQKIVAADASAQDGFGGSVAIHDSLLAVGASNDDDLGFSTGSAYVFRREQDQWQEEVKVFDPTPASGDGFGWSISVHSDLLVVGSVENCYCSVPPPGVPDTGSVNVFRLSGGRWPLEAVLTPTGSVEWFGFSVSATADRVLVGARQTLTDPVWGGSAYLYRFDGADWEEIETFKANDAQEFDQLGTSVSLTETLAVAGAPGDDDAGSDAGAAYVFSVPAARLPFVRGDCDADGDLALGDGLLLLRDLFQDPLGVLDLPCPSACDGNDDGTLSLIDAIAILGAIFLGPAPLPPPAQCGVDPTPDSLRCMSFGC